MPTIRIPQEHWGKVWRTLVASGPIARVSQEPIYQISESQFQLLRRKKLPFQVVSANGLPPEETNGPARP